MLMCLLLFFNFHQTLIRLPSEIGREKKVQTKRCLILTSINVARASLFNQVVVDDWIWIKSNKFWEKYGENLAGTSCVSWISTSDASLVETTEHSPRGILCHPTDIFRTIFQVLYKHANYVIDCNLLVNQKINPLPIYTNGSQVCSVCGFIINKQFKNDFAENIRYTHLNITHSFAKPSSG